MTNVLAVVDWRADGPVGSADEIASASVRLAEEAGGFADAVVVGGPDVGSCAESLGSWGVNAVKVAAHSALAVYDPDGHAEVVANVVSEGDYGLVLFSATERGKDLAPRVAARLDVPLAQDVVSIRIDGTEIEAVRPVFAGKAFAHIGFEARPAIASLRPNAFPATATGGEGAAKVEFLDVVPDPSAWHTRVLDSRSKEQDIPDVARASIVVSGGRGLKGPENWEMLERLRAALGREAGLGASRAVVDAGWRPHSEQVGQTGKTVSPRLYIAVGISGAIQHLAGMRTSGTIVAVNRDPDAPIFKVADYGIVGDAFEVIPRLTEEIQRLKNGG